MSRSVSLRPSPPETVFYHRLSNRHYQVAGGRMRRSQRDAQGLEVNVVEKTVDLAIGSGNHAITYVHRTPEGRLLELPLSYYALDGWAMSPGYDRPDHFDFRREISPACLFCHAGVSRDSLAEGRGQGAWLAASQPTPIGCERCHGETRAHLASPSPGSILNPARLPPPRQLEICLQCHLETASRGFPDSVRRPGRDLYSFRPGEPLADYKSYFDRADGKDRFEVNHAGYRLLQSRCFQGSGGRLTCTTCHDPHTARARQVCGSCHSSPHARTAGDCVPCHLPRRRTEDAIHVRMTDHRIVRQPAFVEPDREDHTPYEGALTLFFGQGGLELAQLRHRIDSGRGTESDYRRRLQLEPDSVQALVALGEALMRFGKRREAVPLLERARRSEPGNVTALNALAVHHAMEGRLERALRLLNEARAANPDHPLTWINLGVTYEVMGDRDQAAAAYREAIRHQPDSSEARRRLASLR